MPSTIKFQTFCTATGSILYFFVSPTMGLLRWRQRCFIVNIYAQHQHHYRNFGLRRTFSNSTPCLHRNNPEQWATNDVVQWLGAHGFAKYATTLEHALPSNHSPTTSLLLCPGHASLLYLSRCAIRYTNVIKKRHFPSHLGMRRTLLQSVSTGRFWSMMWT